MSTEESRYRQQSTDELVESREVVHGSARPGVEPAYTERSMRRGASPLATWVNVIKQKTGRTPMIYSAPGFWNGLPGTGQFAGEVLWVANWQVNCPDKPTPWTGLPLRTSVTV